jgi:hypothetical protein
MAAKRCPIPNPLSATVKCRKAKGHEGDCIDQLGWMKWQAPKPLDK